MNKTEYKEAFSKVQPSDETLERIMNMTNRKKNKSFKRVLITALVIISLVCSIGVIANAATDGAVSEVVSEVVENVSKKVIVLINSKETEQEIILEEGVGEDGEPYYKGEISVTSPDGDEKAYLEFEMNDDGAEIFSSGENIDAILSNSFELYIPTTVAAE